MSASQSDVKHHFSEDINSKIQDLYVLDNWHAVVAIGIDHLMIFFAIYSASINIWLTPIAMILIGSRQRALATILHEASHLSISKNRSFGKVIGTYLSGYLIFQTWDSYKKSHVLNHHHFLGNSEKDPDYIHYTKSGLYERMSKRRFVLRYLIFPLFFINVISMMKYLINNRLHNDLCKTELFKVLMAALAFNLFGYVCLGLIFPVLWLLSYLTVFQTISWFIEVAEHYPIVSVGRNDLYMSRNRFGNFIEEFFMEIHSENFHLIHHLFPRVPFWRMKKAHDILMQDSDYAKLHLNVGGIFSGKNSTTSLWRSKGFFNAIK